MIHYAKPIWVDEVCKNQYIQAKRTFLLENRPQSCKLSVYADGEYVLYVNGSFVGTGQYRTFSGKRAYDEYDVSALLKSGENCIEVEAYSPQQTCFTYCTSNAVLAFSLDGEGVCVTSDKETLVRMHPHYKSGEVEVLSNQLGYTYHYDASAAETKWQTATICSAENSKLVQRPVKKLIWEDIVEGRIISQGYIKREKRGNPAEHIQYDYMSFDCHGNIFDGRTIKKYAEGAYFVIDLEDELAGLLFMSLDASRGTVLDIGYGEHIEDLRVRAKIDERNFAVRYICKGGRQDFCGYFKRLAGRYLQVHISNMTGDVAFNKIGLIPTVYPLDRVGYFKSRDYLINRIYQVSVKTLRLCMHEHYEDCPWREQALYGFDSLVQMLCGYYAFGEYDFARQSLALFGDGVRSDGLLQICAPSSSKMTIPSFCMAWAVSVERYVLYSGDVEFGRQMLPIIKNMLKSFEFVDGLVARSQNPEHWHFYEWSPGLDGYGEQDYDTDAMINLYFIAACQAYNKICEYSGEEPFDVDVKKIQNRVRDTFVNSETGLIRTFMGKELYHEYTQSLAYYTGTVTDERILRTLADKNNSLVKCTLSTSMYKYEVLLSQGTTYFDFVADEIAEIWGGILFDGAKSMWEVRGGAEAFERAGSLCHGWSALPVYLIYKYYIGFEPLEPGFKEYRLEPTTTTNMGRIEAELLMPGETKRI